MVVGDVSFGQQDYLVMDVWILVKTDDGVDVAIGKEVHCSLRKPLRAIIVAVIIGSRGTVESTTREDMLGNPVEPMPFVAHAYWSIGMQGGLETDLSTLECVADG